MRLIDLDKVVKSLTHSIRRSTTVASYVLASAISRIAVLPTIDIVQCKDCKYWDETYFYHSEDDAMQRCICRKHNNIFMTAEDFCSRGVKK